jgi:hypothetical protein
MEAELTTRDKYTKVDIVLTLKVDGVELPNADVLGGGLEKAFEMVQEHVTQSYQEVPPRPVDTPFVGETVPQLTPVQEPVPVTVPATPDDDDDDSWKLPGAGWDSDVPF